MTTTNTPNTDAATLEKALLRENLSVALTLEKAHPDAATDIAEAASHALRYDTRRGGFVDRATGERTDVRDWLRQRKEDRRHWFQRTDAPDRPIGTGKRAGFPSEPDQPTPPGSPAPSAAPSGRRYQEMSEKEFAEYRRQNRHAKLISAVNSGGRRVFTVDCGAAASAQQVGGQSMDDYRKWRETQGLGGPAVPADSGTPPPEVRSQKPSDTPQGLREHQ